jgi:CheY-like chemotaxis protein
MPLRCVLVDDNGAFLETASLLLEREGLTVAGMASSIAEALRQVRALRPDVVLVDIGLGDESGFDLARLLAQDGQGGGAEVILISTGAEADYRELIDESPAAGFLTKSELSVRGIRRILGHTP